MARGLWLTLAIAVSAAMAVSGAEAAAKKKAKAVAKGPPPIARGCTYVQAPYCLGLATSKKATYSLWNGNPWIPPGTAVEVWGKAAGPGPCGGTAIQVTSWKPSKTVKCKS
ncbi:MAG TPA: hypothetical protein VH934_01745 [Xanthobacteraceae bacterium]